MTNSSLQRVQHDLDVIRSSLARDYPYDRRSVVSSGIATLCAVLFSLRAFSGWEKPATVALYLAIIALVVYSGGWWKHARAERGARPRRWRWAQRDTISAAVVILATALYVLLRRAVSPAQVGAFLDWRDQLAGPLIFALGIDMIAVSATRPERRFFAGWGVALAGLGLAMPWLATRNDFWLVGGILMAVGGCVSTALLWWQLRRWEAAHGGD